jgi:hypothetical protein
LVRSESDFKVKDLLGAAIYEGIKPMIVSEITRVDDVINGVGGGDRLGVMNRLGARRGRFEKTEMPDERTSDIRSGEKSLRVVTHGSEGGRSYSSEETLLLPRKEHHTIQNLGQAIQHHQHASNLVLPCYRIKFCMPIK